MKKVRWFQSTSGVAIPETGNFVSGVDGLVLNSQEYLEWASHIGQNPTTQLEEWIRNGYLIINDGVRDLIPANGINLDRAVEYMKYPDAAFNMRFLSDPERQNGFVSKNVQEAIEEGRSNFTGKGFQVSYIGNGTVKNTWLQQEDQNIESNESPDIFKFKARVVAVDFTNQNSNADPIFKIAIRRYPYNNLNDIDDSYKWTINNARSAIKVNQTDGFIVNPGDLMAVYCEDGGGNANDLVVTMDFIVLEAPTQEIQRNYSGYFSSNDFPPTSQIPEIFS